MELKQFPTLREHLEHMLGVKAETRVPLTRAGRGNEETSEDFVIPHSELTSYGIKGMIKNHYLMKGYQAREDGNGIWFEKEKNLRYVNLGFSNSEILVSVIEFPNV
jgi:hypothetical protein